MKNTPEPEQRCWKPQKETESRMQFEKMNATYLKKAIITGFPAHTRKLSFPAA